MGGKDKRKARSCSSRCSTHHHHITVNPDDKDDNHGDGDGPAVQPIIIIIWHHITPMTVIYAKNELFHKSDVCGGISTLDFP